MTEIMAIYHYLKLNDGREACMGPEKIREELKESPPGQGRETVSKEREEDKKSAMERDTQTRCWPSGLDGEGEENNLSGVA